MASRICLQLSLDDPRPGVTIEQLEEALEERQGNRRRPECTDYQWPPELDRRCRDRRRQQTQQSLDGSQDQKVALAG